MLDAAMCVHKLIILRNDLYLEKCFGRNYLYCRMIILRNIWRLKIYIQELLRMFQIIRTLFSTLKKYNIRIWEAMNNTLIRGILCMSRKWNIFLLYFDKSVHKIPKQYCTYNKCSLHGIWKVMYCVKNNEL